MKKSLFNFVLIIFGSALYANLFWREQLGLNVLLFSMFAIGAAGWRWPEAINRREVQLLSGSVVASALLTVWHHSLLAKATHIISFLLLIGFLQQEKVRFVVFAFLLGLVVEFVGMRGMYGFTAACCAVAFVVFRSEWLGISAVARRPAD